MPGDPLTHEPLGDVDPSTALWVTWIARQPCSLILHETPYEETTARSRTFILPPWTITDIGAAFEKTVDTLRQAREREKLPPQEHTFSLIRKEIDLGVIAYQTSSVKRCLDAIAMDPDGLKYQTVWLGRTSHKG